MNTNDVHPFSKSITKYKMQGWHEHLFSNSCYFCYITPFISTTVSTVSYITITNNGETINPTFRIS